MTKPETVTISELIDALPEGSHEDDVRQLRRAFDFAATAHGQRQRQSQELYIDHDLAVAAITAELGVDISTITAALLHDTLLPHTGQELENLAGEFGSEIADLVASLDKLTPYTEKHDATRDDKTLEAIRRAILTIIEGDIRVLLVYLADRLQDIRLADNLPPETQQLLATEARDIYAPLANRLGIWQLKWELEDRAFSYLEPEQYYLIADQIAEKRTERDKRIREAAAILGDKLSEAGIQAHVTGRPKHIYSIYKKMLDKGLNFDHIYDIRALRVIIQDRDPSSCYQALGIVHNLWKPIPQEFDDYIARAKPNGYQSLHTAVTDHKGRTLEVQIRTREMHEEAEKGIAAHWAYKEGGRQASGAISVQVNMLRQLLGGLRENGGPPVEEDDISQELLGERIYVFTPKGDVRDLPAGATPIDFAYAIHTQVGHRCRGARVNGKMVSLDYPLRSGDSVEIITAKKGGPNRDWMNESLGYAGSARTRSKVRSWFRQQEREKNIAQGRDIVHRELKRLGVSDVYTIQDIAEALKFKDTEQFLAKVGFGDIQSTQIGGAIAALQQKLRPDDELRPLLSRKKKSSDKLTVRGIGGLHTRLARCCTPIPPEPIVGYITRGRGITIHAQSCKQLLNTDEPERWIDVEWGGDEEYFPIPIIVKAYRRPGLMDDIANILKGQNISLTKTKTTTADGISTVYLVAEIKSLDQLNWILGKFEHLPNVIEARRQRWKE
ncbi:MAG: bifunctional (p)ppGpp synthetase/guanosine-3',5'-bis(diphosphate) 3'-pyrophosphohydrolase [Chloroflexota bacterium]|jgi:GTP pyrophosphokinase